METTVVNRHHLNNVARALIDARGSNYKYIGRGTLWGNRYIIGRDGTREECIGKYKIGFKKMLAEDPVFVKMTQELSGYNLVCSCKPQPCHGDVIKEYLDSVQSTSGNKCQRCGAEMQMAGIDVYKCPWCGLEHDVCDEEDW